MPDTSNQIWLLVAEALRLADAAGLHDVGIGLDAALVALAREGRCGSRFPV